MARSIALRNAGKSSGCTSFQASLILLQEQPNTVCRFAEKLSLPVASCQTHTAKRATTRLSSRHTTQTRTAFSACSSCDTSVLVPNHCRILPAASRKGATEVKNEWYMPSARRSGKDIWNGSPVERALFHCARTEGSTCGSCTLCQPQPSICFGVAPVYSYQRSLYQ